jgi:hypothetical protein
VILFENKQKIEGKFICCPARGKIVHVTTKVNTHKAGAMGWSE